MQMIILLHKHHIRPHQHHQCNNQIRWIPRRSPSVSAYASVQGQVPHVTNLCIAVHQAAGNVPEMRLLAQGTAYHLYPFVGGQCFNITHVLELTLLLRLHSLHCLIQPIFICLLLCAALAAARGREKKVTEKLADAFI